MSTQNTTAVLLEETRESQLRENANILVNETADELIQEAERIPETLVQPGREDQRQLEPTYPLWPTSTPGPHITSLLPGMKPVSTRTDQMVYESYDQERGVPITPVPEKRSIRRHPLADQVAAGQHVYDTKGSRVGRVLICFPGYILVERGLIFRRSYYVPLWLVQAVKGQRVQLAVSEATLAKQGYTNVPGELYHVPRPSGAIAFPDISGASLLGKYPPTPAETGHYHYGPLGPGINTDAGGSYAPHEVDPYGRPVDRSVKLRVTGKGVHGRSLG